LNQPHNPTNLIPFNNKNTDKVLDSGGPGPDQFRINLESELNLTQKEATSLFGRTLSRLRHSSIAHQCFFGLVTGPESVAWTPCDHLGVEYSGQTREWRNHQWGITIRVRNDRTVEWIRANASRLAHQTDHNGYHVGTQELWDAALSRLWAVLLPLCDQETPPDFRFHTLEVGLVARIPFGKFESLLAGRNYPGMRTPPQWFAGQSIKFGTSPKGSNLSLQIYDKGRHLCNRHFLDIPVNTYSRIEVRLRKDRLRRAFGGDTLDQVTVSRMQDVFYDTLYRLDDGQQDRPLLKLPQSKAGLLALTFILYDECPSPKPMEHPSLWWTGARAGNRNARKMIGEAQTLAGNWKGERLKDLVAVGIEPQSLPIELDWDLEKEMNANPTGS